MKPMSNEELVVILERLANYYEESNGNEKTVGISLILFKKEKETPKNPFGACKYSWNGESMEESDGE